MIIVSHPSRGAWIEIQARNNQRQTRGGRTPHGVRGLKFDIVDGSLDAVGRTPHGVRGLKFRSAGRPCGLCRVAPLTGCVD